MREVLHGDAPCQSREAFRLNEPDATLIERSRLGDHLAYAELVRRYQAVSFRVAYLITGSAEEAQDAAQEGFIRAFRSLDRFDLELPFRPWLLRIVANAARTRRVRAARSFSLSLDAPQASSSVADTERSPEAQALAEEAASELLTAIRALRPDDQLVIALRYFVDLSEAEMADALHCARGTVKSRLSRALGRLRLALGVSSQEVPHG